MTNILINRENCPENNKFKILFGLLNKYLREHGFFKKDEKINIKPKITYRKLFEVLIKCKKYTLIKQLQHVENKDPGYGSIVVPKGGFITNKEVNDLVLLWLRDKDVNIVDVSYEITCLESSLKNG